MCGLQILIANIVVVFVCLYAVWRWTVAMYGENFIYFGTWLHKFTELFMYIASFHL